MGWYLRKSLKLGPLRFNLSKSGIGASAGVKGLRFGSGPKGQYIHAGRGGLYFRQSLKSRETTPLQGNTARPDEVEKGAASASAGKRPMVDWLACTLKRLFVGR